MKPTPASNRQKTLLRKLNRKKYRQQEQLFLSEGARAVEQVLQNKAVAIKGLFFDEAQEYWLQEMWAPYIDKYDAFMLAEDLFGEVTDTDTPQGVLALCHMPDEKEASILSSQKGVIVALDAVQDPGNVGTIVRTAAWFGAVGILAGKGTVDLFHPKVVRGTAGATGVLPYLNGTLSDLLPVFEEAGWPIFLLDAGDEATKLSAISQLEKAIIVVGNEAHGISGHLLTRERQKVCISSSKAQSGVESLNAAMAASIALYDISGKLHG